MKHDSSHKLDFACMDCVLVHLEHKKKLMDFVKKISKDVCERSCPNYCIRCNAEKLLEEIKKDNE